MDRKRRNREHTNSRNGCGQCKARKVKARGYCSTLNYLKLTRPQCDEEKPKCKACTRRNTPCTYTSDGLDQLASAASAASSPFERQDHSFSFTPIQAQFGKPQPETRPSSTGFTPIQQEYRAITPKHDIIKPQSQQRNTPLRPPPQSVPRTSLDLNMGHLELFHHFIAVTSSAISAGYLGLELWRMTIPKIALSHDWLMHSILAVSALHIARLRPEEQDMYWKRAAMHQDQALQGQQKALANPSPDNADALFAFTLVIIYLSFAAENLLEGAGREPLQGIIRCLHMLRGIRAISPAVKHWVEGGPLAHILSLHPGNIKSAPTFREASTEAHFSKLLVFSSTNADLNEDHEMNDTESYASAASSLRASFLKVEAIPEGGPLTPPIWHWAVRLHASFVTRLSERHVVPLVLVAHWCVLLTEVQHYWWIQGWVDKTMNDIQSCLPRENHEWLDWPAEKIREIRRIKGG